MNGFRLNAPHYSIVFAMLVFALVSYSSSGAAQSDARLVPPAEASDVGVTIESSADCRMWVFGIFVSTEDVGPEQAKAEAREICGQGGSPDVSFDEAVETISDNVDFEPTNDDGWSDAVISVLYLLFVGGFVTLVFWVYQRREQRLDAVMSEGEAAFEMDFHIEELRSNPEQLEEIRDQVEEICIMRVSASEGGGYGGSRMRVKYIGFVIDIEGATHEFARSRDWADVETHAEWLAEQLDVEIRDRSYG